MNQTPNYQLNQWEKTDRIQMEDFNADNAKIEAALAQIQSLSPVEWIMDVTTTANTSSQYNLDVSAVDFTKYREVFLYVEPATASTTSSLYVQLNGISSYRNSSSTAQDHICSFGIDTNEKQGYTCVHLCLGKGFISGSASSDYASGSQYFPTTSERLIAILAPDDLETINFKILQSGKKLAAGSRFKMMGVKK